MSRPLRHADLLSPKEAAEFLGLGVDVFREFVKRGELRFINLGLGKKRIHRMYDKADLIEFIARRKEVEACPSINRKARKSSFMISNGEVIGFRARQALSQSGKLSR